MSPKNLPGFCVTCKWNISVDLKALPNTNSTEILPIKIEIERALEKEKDTCQPDVDTEREACITQSCILTQYLSIYKLAQFIITEYTETEIIYFK